MTSAISASGGGYSSIATTLQQQLFSKVDSNGDKSIDKTELTSFLDIVSQKTGGSSVDSESVLTALDTDSSGEISESELQDNGAALLEQLRSQMMSSESSRGAPPPPQGSADDLFSAIDSDENGAISETELDTFLSASTSETGDASSADEIFARDDADGDGSISLAEFTQAVSNRDESARAEGGGQLERLMASLLAQYSAISANSDASATETLSVSA